MPPRALVIRAAGTNCDVEMCRAFELAGASANLAHIDRLVERPETLDRYDLLGFPGGFSYGDDIASGRIFAMKLRERLYPALRDAARRACPMIGICNGFQVLVQVGLLPGPPPGQDWPEDAPPPQRVALSDNSGACYVDKWVGIRPEPASICVWTRDLPELLLDRPSDRRDVLQLPVGHGEGRFVAAPGVIEELERAGQVALRYENNFNGSQGAIAGICDPSGRIFGLMPHPDRYLDWTRHPYWTRLSPDLRRSDTVGVLIFKSAVEAARQARV